MARSIYLRSKRCSRRTAKNRRIAMRKHLSLLIFLLPIAASRADEREAVRLEFVAQDMAAKNTAVVKGPSGEPAIQVTGAAEGSTTTIVLCIDPPITSHHYVVRGQVKYEGVAQNGYLELLNDFGPQ